MSPVARVAAATGVFVAAAAANQFTALRDARDKASVAAAYSPLIGQARAGAARSPRPDLYAPGARLGYRAVGAVNQGVALNGLHAARAALAPAVVAPDPGGGPTVVFFPTPADADRFNPAGGELLDRLGPHLAVYHFPPK